MFQIRTATRKQTKLRIGIGGVSGSGKTFRALQLGYGITDDWTKVGMIDSENGRGEIYAEDMGKYLYGRISAPFTPEKYIEAIKAMEQTGVECIIIDSMSHVWEAEGGILQTNETLAQAKYRGNSYAAWNESTPRYQKLIEAIIQSPAHIISCFRSKSELILTDNNGKKEVQKVGMKLIQRDGIEYEYTVMLEVDLKTHMAMVTAKDNTHTLDKLGPFQITPEHGKQLINWAQSGEEVKPEPKPEPVVTKQDVADYIIATAPEATGTKAKIAAYILEKTGLDAKTTEPSIILEALKKS